MFCYRFSRSALEGSVCDKKKESLCFYFISTQSMKSACFLLFVFFFGLVVCQNSCDLQGPYACSGGDILGMDFGDDEDDDFFEYFTSSGDTTTTDSCTVQQQGVYSISGSTIEVEFEIDDDECIISGDSNDCECIDNLTLTVSNNCGTIEGPNGETCTPADSKYLK